MIDWVITYEIIGGFLFQILNHNRLVVRGITFPRNAIRHHTTTVRVVAYGVLAFLDSQLHITSSGGYFRWWREYRCRHTLGFWLLVGLAPTLALHLLATITFLTARDPHGYRLYPDGAREPILLRTSMRTPAIWFVAFWIWALLTPSLPLRTCYLRGILSPREPALVFPPPGYEPGMPGTP